jgi:NAD-dependent deacetylase sirtuin 2
MEKEAEKMKKEGKEEEEEEEEEASSTPSSPLGEIIVASRKEEESASSSSSRSASLKSETESSGSETEEDDDDGYSSSSSSSSSSEGVRELLKRLALGNDEEREKSLASRQPKLKSRDLEGVAAYMRSDACKNIVVMCGAGVSVSAGIPDFRTPGTGLYDNLAAYDLPYPQAVFEIGFFKSNPEPFYLLASHLQPGKFEPTKTHKFIKLLEKKKKLRRCFTQNIDSLETKAGVSEELVVAAHGNFDTARCLRGHSQNIEKVMEHVAKGQPMRCEQCEEYVKPDIVFFGENLPVRFGQLAKVDFNRENCDLLIVMGTSLQVQPFAGLIEYPDIDCPRILINREKVGEVPSRRSFFEMGMSKGRGFDFSEEGKRDVLFLGDCDDGVIQLCEHLGWELE